MAIPRSCFPSSFTRETAGRPQTPLAVEEQRSQGPGDGSAELKGRRELRKHCSIHLSQPSDDAHWLLPPAAMHLLLPGTNKSSKHPRGPCRHLSEGCWRNIQISSHCRKLRAHPTSFPVLSAAEAALGKKQFSASHWRAFTTSNSSPASQACNAACPVQT